jgi:hypothetical protein
VDLGDRSIFFVFGALDGAITHVHSFVEERPVLGLVVNWVGSTVPVHCVDQLTGTLVWLLGLAVDSHLVFSRVTVDGVYRRQIFGQLFRPPLAPPFCAKACSLVVGLLSSGDPSSWVKATPVFRPAPVFWPRSLLRFEGSFL